MEGRQGVGEVARLPHLYQPAPLPRTRVPAAAGSKGLSAPSLTLPLSLGPCSLWRSEQLCGSPSHHSQTPGHISQGQPHLPAEGLQARPP